MISAFSVLNAIACCTLMMLLIEVLQHVTSFLKRGGVSALLILSAFAALRVLLPVEIAITRAVRSWDCLGEIQKHLRTYSATPTFFMVVWGLGAAVFAGACALQLYCDHKRRCNYIIVEDETVQRIARRISAPCPVVVSPNVETPYVAGFFRHTIYFPVVDLPENRIEMALAHEIQHIRTHDALIKLFFGIMTAVLWWNCVVHWFRNVVSTLLEMRCDARVMAGMDDHEQQEYGEMLKTMADLVVKNKSTPRLVLDESRVVRKAGNSLVQRFHVMFGSKPSLVLRMISMCLVTVLFCASYLVVFQGAGAAPAENFQNDARTYYEENFDGPELGDGTYSSFIVKGSDGRYQLFVDYRFIRYLSEKEATSDNYKDFLFFEENRQR